MTQIGSVLGVIENTHVARKTSMSDKETDCDTTPSFSSQKLQNMKVQLQMKDTIESMEHKKEKFPRLLSSDDISVDSTSSAKWAQPYEPPPLVNQSTILLLGFAIFVLASVWPPLILLVAYIASKLVPYSFRVNDDPATRRRLFAEFSNQEDLPDSFKNPPDDLAMEHGFWTNKRYVHY